MKIRMTVLVVMTLLFGAIAIGCESSPKTTSYVKLLDYSQESRHKKVKTLRKKGLHLWWN